VKKIALSAAALGLLALMIWAFRGARGEDFVYYYCAGATAGVGASPYAERPYGDCVREALGGAPLRLSAPTGSAYPPPAIAAFRALARLPYDRAFVLWSLILAAAALAVLRALSRGPADALIVMTWPGIVLCWISHKLALLALAVFLGAFAGLEAAPAASGALLGLLVVQPQWLAAGALYLAARRRWRPLAFAVGVGAALFAATARAGWASEWARSAGVHAAALTGYDNQSLFLAAAKLVGPLGGGGWFLPGRLACGAALAALAFAAAARGAGPPVYLGLVLLAQPYSHGADSIWALPLLLAARDRWRAALGARAGAVDAAFVALNLLFCGLCLYTRYGFDAAVDRQGYLTLAAAAAWAATGLPRRLPRSRRGRSAVGI
jgi:hypothetical protein